MKLTRYGVSYAAGAGIGAGIGAGVGVALAGSDALFVSDKGKWGTAGAGIGALGGAVVTGPVDLFKGPTVYRR